MSLSHALVTLNSSNPTILTIPTNQEAEYASSLSTSIQNVSISVVYLGSSSVSTLSYGAKLSPGQTITLDLAPGDDLYGISDANSTDVAILRVSK